MFFVSNDQLHGAHIEVDITQGTPALINTPEMAAIAREAATRAVGQDNVQPMAMVNMGGEDFACYLEHIKGCYVRIGAAYTDRDNYPAHSSKFDIDENALAYGARYYQALAHVAGKRIAGHN